MLTSFWQSVVGQNGSGLQSESEESSASVSPSKQPKQQPQQQQRSSPRQKQRHATKQHGTSHAKQALPQDLEQAAQEDELVDALLSQFPTYGTLSGHNTHHTHNMSAHAAANRMISRSASSGSHHSSSHHHSSGSTQPHNKAADGSLVLDEDHGITRGSNHPNMDPATQNRRRMEALQRRRRRQQQLRSPTQTMNHSNQPRSHDPNDDDQTEDNYFPEDDSGDGDEDEDDLPYSATYLQDHAQSQSSMILGRMSMLHDNNDDNDNDHDDDEDHELLDPSIMASLDTTDLDETTSYYDDYYEEDSDHGSPMTTRAMSSRAVRKNRDLAVREVYMAELLARRANHRHLNQTRNPGETRRTSVPPRTTLDLLPTSPRAGSTPSGMTTTTTTATGTTGKSREEKSSHTTWDADEADLWKPKPFMSLSKKSNHRTTLTSTTSHSGQTWGVPSSTRGGDMGGSLSSSTIMPQRRYQPRRHRWHEAANAPSTEYHPEGTQYNRKLRNGTITTASHRRSKVVPQHQEQVVDPWHMERRKEWIDGGPKGRLDATTNNVARPKNNNHPLSPGGGAGIYSPPQSPYNNHKIIRSPTSSPPPPLPSLPLSPNSPSSFSSFSFLVPHHQDANDYYNHHSYPSRNPQEEEDDDDDDDSGDGTNNINDSGRQHWMPDKLCKHCYSCEVQFTVFRRRHHCRLCGQVFCSACSAYFVDLAPTVHSEEEEGVSPAGHATTQTKHSGLTSIGKVEGATPHDTISGPFDRKDAGATSSTVASASGVGFASATGDGLAQSRTMRACKMCYDQVSRSGGLVSVSSSPNMARSTAPSEVTCTTPANLVSTNPSDSLLPSLKGASPLVIPSENILSGLDSSTLDVVDSKDSLSLSHTHPPIGNDQEASIITEEQPDVQHDGENVPSKNDSLDSKALPAEMHPSVVTRIGSATQLDTMAETVAAAPENSIKEANRHLGLMAATHLEKMGKELLLSDAPLLIEELQASTKQDDVDGLLAPWIDKIMMLATRCCATVKPNVKKGDLLDIRPYCKIKVIAGGSKSECAYMSGIVFCKNVSHKRMAKEIENPRIMLLSGGIEYTRTENRIASLDTLLEQEEKYLSILVTKIVKLKPDLLMVGRSVSRKAQEMLLAANVTLVQHVKSTLMTRIARQSGATILSSTDHVMNQFGTSVLGKSRRFRLVTFRDDEWLDRAYGGKGKGDDKKPPSKSGAKSSESALSIENLLKKEDLSNAERQAILAANKLGDGVLDGTEAIRSGLAKRGVARTYVMIEGCPKELGCTVVLRGASRLILKQIKRVLRFLINVAYNLKLETSYLRDRCARLPPNYSLPDQPLCSSSLCVDYGNPPNNRKVRPWNGGKADASQRSISGNITAFDHQSILITSVWMTDKSQCCPAEVKGICYYSLQDVSLGQFLRDSCFNLSLKCQNPSCKKSVLEHNLSFVHNDGMINITVEHMDDPLPPAPLDNSGKGDNSAGANKSSSRRNKQPDAPIATWSYCNECSKVVTPLVYISDDTWKFSFGKFLEVFFYNKEAILNTREHRCSCQMQSASTLYFGCGRFAARFTYETVRPYGVYVRRQLPFDEPYHVTDAIRQLEAISTASSELFVAFDKQVDKISREARALFGSPANKPEYLQTVHSEVNTIGSEVDHAAKTLQEKIGAITNKYHEDALAQAASNEDSEDKLSVSYEKLFRFPWHARRHLFMLMTSWNERLSAAGQALAAMRKLTAAVQAASNSGRNDLGAGGIQGIGDASTEDVTETMRRIRQLHDMYSHYNVSDIGNINQRSNSFARKGRKPAIKNDAFDGDKGNSIMSEMVPDPDFSSEVDADVLASRRRFYNHIPANAPPPEPRKQAPSSPVKKYLGTRPQHDSFGSHGRQNSFSSQFSNAAARYGEQKTPGGAVKSAINRFFNRGNKELDPNVVDLNMFAEGRPRLDPGVKGMITPVFDDQPSTVIAHSLSSVEYDVQFKEFTDNDSSSSSKAGSSTGMADDRNNEDPPSLADASRKKRQDRKSKRGSDGRSASLAQTNTPPMTVQEERKDIERRMLVRSKTHIKHTFRDFDEKGQQTCKFVCTTYWATQFHTVRQAFMSPGASNSKDPNTEKSSSSDKSRLEADKNYIRSLATSYAWAASGGKSGASFARTADEQFVVKCISRTELQMFLDCAPAYFEYLSKAFFHGLPTVLCKIVGVYQIGYHNRVSGKRTMEQVAVMQNIFYGRKISKTFDLKGSLRGRFTQKDKTAAESADAQGSEAQGPDTQVSSDQVDLSVSPQISPTKNKRSRRKKVRISRSSGSSSDSDYSSEHQDDEDSYYSSDASSDDNEHHPSNLSSSLASDIKEKKRGSLALPGSEIEVTAVPTATDQEKKELSTLLDGDFLHFTAGRPLPLSDRAKAVFHMSVLNDALFLSIINVLDYSILVGIDEERMELVVGIIDFMRQYDILKQMERVGKSLPTLVGSEAPTIIQPPLYKARFTNAMERYFMTVPSKWTSI